MKARTAFAAALTAAVVVTSSASAEAQEAKGLGDRSQFIISADRLVPLFAYTSASVTQDGNDIVTQNSSSISLLYGREGAGADASTFNPHTIPRVAFDFTIIRGLTLGGALIVAFGLGGSTEVPTGAPGQTLRTDSPTTTVFGFGPRVGYIIPIGEVLAFWPRGGFSFYSVSTVEDIRQGGQPAERTTTNSLLSLDLDPQFMVVPLQHFFFTAGPLVTVPFTGGSTLEQPQGGNTVVTERDLSLFHIGLSLGIGGWFNL
jgi:hypothetical protein